MRPPFLNAIAVLLMGCGVEPIDFEDAGNAVPGRIQRIFDDSCALSGCHDASAQGGLSLTAGASAAILSTQATQNPALQLVQIGSVESSYLAIKILPDHPERVGSLMPLRPGELSDEDRTLLIGWIAGSPLGGTSGAGTEGETTDVSDAESDTGMVVQACGIDDVKTGAKSPVVSGTEVGEIPPDIAEVLENNCGCHYATGLDAPVPDYPETGRLDIATWEGFHEELPPVAYELVQQRINSDAAPMPPTACVLDDGSRIRDEDLELLNAWLDAGAPDGATWAG